LRRRGDVLVVLAEVHEEWRPDSRCFFDIVLRTAAVVGDGRIGCVTRRGKVCHESSQAIPHNADFAGRRRLRASDREASSDIGDTYVSIEGVVESEAPLPLSVGLIRKIDAGLKSPEKVGAHRKIALRGELVACLAQVRVYAKDLLKDDEGRRRLRG